MSAPAFLTDRVDPVSIGEIVNLEVCYTDADGMPINTDSIPQVEIITPDADGSFAPGSVVLPLTSTGVTQVKNGLGVDVIGRYKFSYMIPPGSNTGVWRDRWVTTIGGKVVDNSFTFQVISGGTVKAVVEEPSPVLGEKPKLEFSPQAIENINELLAALKATLKNDGFREVVDPITGDVTLVTCSVFTDDELLQFLCISLAEFNARPHFTNFTFDDPRVVNPFKHILTEGANIIALAAQWLVEKGREFNVVDNGISFQPPQISDVINTQYSTKLSSYNEKLDMIKLNIRPGPLGLGTFRVLAVSPQFLRLRHLRARQIV